MLTYRWHYTTHGAEPIRRAIRKHWRTSSARRNPPHRRIARKCMPTPSWRNAIKYFGPYLAEMRLDWDEELRKALSRASRCKRYDLKPLRLMMAQIEDAHVRYVEPAASKARERFYRCKSVKWKG